MPNQCFQINYVVILDLEKKNVPKRKSDEIKATEELENLVIHEKRPRKSDDFYAILADVVQPAGYTLDDLHNEFLTEELSPDPDYSLKTDPRLV